MVLVDTSVWVNHLRGGDKLLEKLLINGDVVCHSFIIGELACGNIKNQKEIISLLQALPKASSIEFEEFLYFIEENQLNGKKIGFVDIHLLASAQLDQIKLWTEDKRLKKAAIELGLHVN
ncbi:MAG: type II toxin-antitoxin system VapC family toxin [Deltaproteobacteria bacterium]|nr:type II toxin-antitoxin system VapC family toxin [Deltaproteobacteria bacterium]